MLHTKGKQLLGVNLYGKRMVAVPLVGRIKTPSDFSKGTLTEGYGFKDGEIKGPYIDSAKNSSEYILTPTINNYFMPLSSSITGLSGTGSYRLNNDIELNLTSFQDEASVFSGILDGCGHTLTINCEQSANWSNEHKWGALIGTLTGKIRNIKIITNFHWKNNNSTGENQFVGGVVGIINGGSLENVFVQVGYYGTSEYNMEYSGKPTSNGQKMVGGIAGEIDGTTTLTNVTVQIDNMGWGNSAAGTPGLRPAVNLGIGGFVGHIAANAIVTFKNCSNRGSGNLKSYCNRGGGDTSAQGAKVYKGGFFALSEGDVIIKNVKSSWSGTLVHDGGSRNVYECSIGGSIWKTLTIENLFYSSNSYVKANGWLELENTKTTIMTGANGALTVVSGQEYDDSLDNYIGFTDDYVWFGDITRSVREMDINIHTIRGEFVSKIGFADRIESVGDRISLFNFGKAGILRALANNEIFKVVIDTTKECPKKLNSISYGYYGYLSNEPGSLSGKYKLYFNNGQTIDYMFSTSNHYIGIYDVNILEEINNVQYCITRNTNTNYYS